MFTDRIITVTNKKALFVKKGIINQTIPKAISLICSYSSNYFHFLYEVIAKFYYINNCNIPLTIPLLIDKKIENISQFIELLNIFNTKKRKIIYLESKTFTKVNEFIKLPSTLLAPPNFKNLKFISHQDYRYNIESLAYVRKTLLKHMEIKDTPKRIFLSRKKASTRRRYNEGEVIDCLNKYNFKEVFTERLTVTEQVNLFYNAEFVVGATGAAFSNILFCNDKCEILCLTNYRIPLGIFSSIGAIVGIKMHYLHDNTKKINNNSDLHDDFNVDIKSLNTFIQKRMSN